MVTLLPFFFSFHLLFSGLRSVQLFLVLGAQGQHRVGDNGDLLLDDSQIGGVGRDNRQHKRHQIALNDDMRVHPGGHVAQLPHRYSRALRSRRARAHVRGTSSAAIQPKKASVVSSFLCCFPGAPLSAHLLCRNREPRRHRGAHAVDEVVDAFDLSSCITRRTGQWCCEQPAAATAASARNKSVAVSRSPEEMMAPSTELRTTACASGNLHTAQRPRGHVASALPEAAACCCASGSAPAQDRLEDARRLVLLRPCRAERKKRRVM